MMEESCLTFKESGKVRYYHKAWYIKRPNKLVLEERKECLRSFLNTQYRSKVENLQWGGIPNLFREDIWNIAYDENMCEPIRTCKCKGTSWLINYMYIIAIVNNLCLIIYRLYYLQIYSKRSIRYTGLMKQQHLMAYRSWFSIKRRLIVNMGKTAKSIRKIEVQKAMTKIWEFLDSSLKLEQIHERFKWKFAAIKTLQLWQKPNRERRSRRRKEKFINLFESNF